MAQELVEAASLIAMVKGLLITILGFILKLLWFWKNRPSIPRIMAAGIFCCFSYWMVKVNAPEQYRGPLWFVSGMLASNIITTIFELAKINEEGVKTYFINWWKNK